jgi:ATP-dependent protease ClpP protease subunit
MLPRARKEVPRSWYGITNKADSAQVHIYAEIGAWGITADAMCKELSALDAKAIDVRINSPGGDVFDGIAIHNALASHPATINVHVDGVAASIASVIAMAGDKVTMARGSQMMIHEGHTVAVGAAADMRKQADLLDTVSDTIARFYAERAGGTVGDWRNRMRCETWYSAEEAVQAGLADEVAVPSRTIKATWDLSVFNYAGRRHAPAPDLTKAVPVVEAVAPQPKPVTVPARARVRPTREPALVPAQATTTTSADSILGLLLTTPSNGDSVLSALLKEGSK